MKILQRHVAREILVPFALAFVVMTLLTLVGDMLQELAQRFTNRGLELGDLVKMILYVLPTLMIYTIPVALLFATLAAFAQLSQDCEVIAMKAAGIPIRKIFAPAILIGVAASTLLLALCVEVSPWARRELKVFVINTVLAKPTLMLREQAWTPEVDSMRIFVGEINDSDMTLKDVNVVVSKEDEPSRTIVAESGEISVDSETKKIFLELNQEKRTVAQRVDEQNLQSGDQDPGAESPDRSDRQAHRAGFHAADVRAHRRAPWNNPLQDASLLRLGGVHVAVGGLLRALDARRRPVR